MEDDIENIDREKKLNATKEKSMLKLSCALISLLQSKRYDEVNVADICDEAKISRKTFYHNFTDKNDALKFALDNAFNELSSKFDFGDADVTDVYRAAFELLAQNRGFGKVFTDNAALEITTERLKVYIEFSYKKLLHGASTFEPSVNEYYFRFMADGIISLFRSWLLAGCKQSPDTMARIMRRALSGVIL